MRCTPGHIHDIEIRIETGDNSAAAELCGCFLPEIKAASVFLGECNQMPPRKCVACSLARLSRTILTKFNISVIKINGRCLFIKWEGQVKGSLTPVGKRRIIKLRENSSPVIPNSIPTSGPYYGCDSNTSSNVSCGTNFYIGKMGYGDTAYSNGGEGCTTCNGWNQSGANLAGPANTYGYWYLQGMDASAASGLTPTEWGSKQGQKTISAYDSNNDVQMHVIWGDVETNDAYWTTTSDNIDVIKAWCAEIANAGYSPGIYSSPCLWDEITGSANVSDVGGMYEWVAWPNETANTPYCSSSQTANSCIACPANMTSTSFGGMAPSIWQYVVGGQNGCSTDLDFAINLPT